MMTVDLIGSGHIEKRNRISDMSLIWDSNVVVLPSAVT
jgi:hypothetical protein